MSYCASNHMQWNFLQAYVGEGRRHGEVALICKRLAGLKLSEISCEDSRLCGVTVSNDHGPIASILGCYMPFWDGSANTYVNFADILLVS